MTTEYAQLKEVQTRARRDDLEKGVPNLIVLRILGRESIKTRLGKMMEMIGQQRRTLKVEVAPALATPNTTIEARATTRNNDRHD